MAALVGDALRGRAQAEILKLDGPRSAARLEGPAPSGERGGAERARDITTAVEAVLADVAG